MTNTEIKPDTETVVEPEDLEPGDTVVHLELAVDREPKYALKTIDCAEQFGFGDAWDISFEGEGGKVKPENLNGQDEGTKSTVFYPKEE